MYNVTRVLMKDDTFNLTAYDEYSPLYMPAAYAITYMLAFALTTCVIVHTILYHGRSVLNGLRRIKVEKDDIHAKLMKNYPEVPDWWYALVFVFFFCMAILAMEVCHFPPGYVGLAWIDLWFRSGIRVSPSGPCSSRCRCQSSISCLLDLSTP